MHGSSRNGSVERRLSAAAVAIGRVVTRAASVLPPIVRRASGLDRPSPEAVFAGVIRGLTALAPAALGAAGRCVDLAGTASVLAIATWTADAEAEQEKRQCVLAHAIAHVERRGLCAPQTAAIWRATAGVAPVARDLVTVDVLAGIGSSAARNLSRNAVVEAFAQTKPFRLLDVGVAFADAWDAMGQAARLVDATREVAAEQATSPEGELVVMDVAPVIRVARGAA